MGETSFPVAGGTGVTDARYETLIGPLSGCGRVAKDIDVVPYNTALVFGDGSGRQVKFRASDGAIVRGFRWETDSSGLTVPLTANTSGKLRIDLITLRLDRQDFTVRAHVLQGAPGASTTSATPPNPVQDLGSTGVYDWPVAQVKVTTNNTTGQPLIQAADVTRLDHFIASTSSANGSGRGLNIPPPGSLSTDIPGKTVIAGIGRNSYMLIGEDGTFTKVEAGPGWGSDSLYFQRRNGFTYMQGIAQLTASDKAASTSLMVVQTLPPEFKPPQDVYLHGFYSPGYPFRAIITSGGEFRIVMYPTTMQQNSSISFQPTCWPSRY